MAQQFCPHCGKAIEEAAIFCPGCGLKVASPQGKKRKGLLIGIVSGLVILLAVGATSLILHFGKSEIPVSISESPSPSEQEEKSSKPPVAKSATVQLEKAEGSVLLTSILGKELSVVEGMQLLDGNSVATQVDSYAYLNLDRSRAAKLDSLSTMELRQEVADLELNLTQGSLFFNITQPLDKEETLNIRTSTMVIGIRGTSGIVHASQVGIPDGIFVLDGSVTLLYEGKDITVSAKHKAELIDDSGESSILITELTETELDEFAVEEIRKDAALQKRLENSRWDVDRILNIRSPETIEMYAAYLDAIEQYGTVLTEYSKISVPVYGGGLLDFNSDGIEDLVLIYSGEIGDTICSVFSYQSGSIQALFTKTLWYDASDGAMPEIYESDGKGCITVKLRFYDYDYRIEELADGEWQKLPNNSGQTFMTYQNGKLQEELYYRLEPILDYQDPYYVITQVEWEIWRDGVQTQKGNVPSFDSDMPEIEAVKIEAEETYGNKWSWILLDELKAFLAN
jgi:hypothetical protein